jgi:type IV secretory pathway VirB10-like protein
VNGDTSTNGDQHTDSPHPGEMRLRPTRPPVVRLSRKVLLGLGLVVGAGIAGALFIALRPHPQTASSQLYNTNNRAMPEGLSNLPRDYSHLPRTVPRLGPPLPGDLGRPIVNAGAPAPNMGMPDTATPEQQHLAQEQEAARTSHLFTTTDISQHNNAAAQPMTPQANTTIPSSSSVPASQTGADQTLAFLNGATDHQTQALDRIEAPASPYILQAGAVIPAALITGLRSDLPGEVTAQVTQDVFDSPTGTTLLIPEGARLVGEYSAQVSFGQTRALLVWTRLIMPNGRSIVLERQPATDAQGYAGLEDEIDNHWGTLFQAAVLSTLLSIGSEAGTGSNENSLVQAIRQGSSQGFNQVGEQVVGRSLSVQPTITIRPGFPVRVLVTRDLVLEPYGA